MVTAFHQREMSKESCVVLPRKVLACLLVCGVVGCMDARVTTPARSATEQLLLTTAADLAAEKLRLEKLSGKRVALCLLYTSPSPRDVEESRMPSSA